MIFEVRSIALLYLNDFFSLPQVYLQAISAAFHIIPLD